MVDPNLRGQSPSHYIPNHLCWPSQGFSGSHQAATYPTIHPELVKSQLDPQAWGQTTHPNMTGCAVAPCYTTAGTLFSSGPNSVGNDGCYSLFSEQQSPFGLSLLSHGSPDKCSSANVMTASGGSTSENSPLTAAKQGFDEWPVLWLTVAAVVTVPMTIHWKTGTLYYAVLWQLAMLYCGNWPTISHLQIPLM